MVESSSTAKKNKVLRFNIEKSTKVSADNAQQSDRLSTLHLKVNSRLLIEIIVWSTSGNKQSLIGINRAETNYTTLPSVVVCCLVLTLHDTWHTACTSVCRNAHLSLSQFSSCSSDSALCLPGASSDSEASPALDRQLRDKTEDVFTSESENSSVATTRTVRRVDPNTGEVTAGSPSTSLSFGSNLSLTVSEGERDKQPAKVPAPVSIKSDISMYYVTVQSMIYWARVISLPLYSLLFTVFSQRQTENQKSECWVLNKSDPSQQ